MTCRVLAWKLLAIGLLTTLFGLGCAAETTMKPSSDFPCLRIGHRGAASLAPENTLAAVRAALAAGVDGIEFDVRRSADGLPIVIHDDNLKRTTDGGDVKVAGRTLEQLRALDAGSWGDWKASGRFAGEKLPLLDEFVAEVVRGGAFPVVELKVAGLEAETAEVLNRHAVADRAWVISFQYGVMETFADKYPAVSIAWLVDKKNFQEMGLAGVVQAATLVGCKALNAQFQTVTPELVEAVHAAGMLMLVWTVNKSEDMERMVRMGVDGITTDRPQDLNRVLARLRGE